MVRFMARSLKITIEESVEFLEKQLKILVLPVRKNEYKYYGG